MGKNKKGPFLVKMTAQAFEAIAQKAVPRSVRREDPTFYGEEAVEYIFHAYCEKLFYANASLQNILDKIVHAPDDPRLWQPITQGQAILFSVEALDAQVNNGGLPQFFWNCSELIFALSDALKVIKATQLLKLYERAVDELIGNKKKWVKLYNQAYEDSSNPNWEPFQKSYDLLNIEWFDDAYFAKQGPALLKRVVKYVKSHSEEFIEP
jgi:Domain of unknown function (DUF4375)